MEDEILNEVEMENNSDIEATEILLNINYKIPGLLKKYKPIFLRKVVLDCNMSRESRMTVI